MKKFTVIAEYKGGTYVSQHYADTVDEAVMKFRVPYSVYLKENG